MFVCLHVHAHIMFFTNYISILLDSFTRNIEVGVPQGSCLGSVLFFIYINDLPKAVQRSTASMYSDDTSL